jgi:hypothetical protein
MTTTEDSNVPIFNSTTNTSIDTTNTETNINSTNTEIPSTTNSTTKNKKQQKPAKPDQFHYVKPTDTKEKKKQIPPAHTTKRQPLNLNALSINEKYEMAETGKKKGYSKPPPDVTQILPHLYLGSAINAADSELVGNLGLGCVLNVAEELERMVSHEGVESIRMVVHDFMPDGMDQHNIFEKAFALIGTSFSFLIILLFCYNSFLTR